MNGNKAKYHKVEKTLKEECIRHNALACYISPKENESNTQTFTRRRKIKSDLKKHKDFTVRSTVVYKQQQIESARLAATLSIPSSPIRRKSPPKKE